MFARCENKPPKIASTGIVVLSLVLMRGEAARGQAPHQNVGDAVGDLPDVLIWHWKVFWLFPTNLEDFEKAWQEERNKLKPGESRTFEIMMNTVPGAGEPLRFIGLKPEGVEWLSGKAVAKIKIEKERFVLASPIPPLSEAAFQRLTKLCRSEATYEDHLFATEAWNAHNRRPAGTHFVDLLDRTARAGADGMVILTADGDESSYSVYNEATQKTEVYKKGRELRQLGHTIWIHTKTDGRGYTIVYSNLSTAPKLHAGAEVTLSQELGTYEGKSGRFFTIWRADKPEQHFLRNGAYLVEPLCLDR